jgi:hypothetical protein
MTTGAINQVMAMYDLTDIEHSVFLLLSVTAHAL